LPNKDSIKGRIKKGIYAAFASFAPPFRKMKKPDFWARLIRLIVAVQNLRPVLKH
jgi:hypothetical protein